MKSFFLFSTALLFLFLGLTGCSMVQRGYDFDPGVDFSRYHSFAVRETVGGDDGLADEPLRRKRLITAVKRALLARGFVEAGPAGSDFFVKLHSRLRRRQELREVHIGFFSYFDPWWGSYEMPVEVETVEEEMVIIDFVDARTGEVIWRGTGIGLPSSGTTGDKLRLQADLDREIARILENFPPPDKK